MTTDELVELYTIHANKTSQGKYKVYDVTYQHDDRFPYLSFKILHLGMILEAHASVPHKFQEVVYGHAKEWVDGIWNPETSKGLVYWDSLRYNHHYLSEFLNKERENLLTNSNCMVL